MPHCWKSHISAQLLFCPGSQSYSYSISGDLSLEKLYENSWKKFSERDFLKVKDVLYIVLVMVIIFNIMISK